MCLPGFFPHALAGKGFRLAENQFGASMGNSAPIGAQHRCRCNHGPAIGDSWLGAGAFTGLCDRHSEAIRRPAPLHGAHHTGVARKTARAAGGNAARRNRRHPARNCPASGRPGWHTGPGRTCMAGRIAVRLRWPGHRGAGSGQENANGAGHAGPPSAGPGALDRRILSPHHGRATVDRRIQYPHDCAISAGTHAIAGCAHSLRSCAHHTNHDGWLGAHPGQPRQQRGGHRGWAICFASGWRHVPGFSHTHSQSRIRHQCQGGGA